MPVFEVPKILSDEFTIYQNKINEFINHINIFNPSLKVPNKPAEEQHKSISNTPLLCPCACSQCPSTEVHVFHVKQMRDYLKIIGALILKSKGTYMGGLTALRKVQAIKRIPLCRTHFDMMAVGELPWKDLRVTDGMQVKRIMDRLELLEKPYKNRIKRTKINNK